MTKANPKVDAWMAREKAWPAECAALREVAQASGLTEDFKWGQPCYTLDGRNIVLIHGFKDYCALLFFKGALMKDPKGLLIRQTDNVQSVRQIRFTDLAQIEALRDDLKAYIEDAIAVETSGAKVERKATEQFPMPEELAARLDADFALKTAFHALTPGRQRGYLLHIASAKQAKTRESRIDKCAPRILAGKGLDD
ncbi:MAG: YdeI/OmpD-associated family protein [Asticcacaulis sp.]|uniref:YdeI/OmpD-associated family protein n=1 Tax=Asticcacaulis sp. TaxID=1872648 RepID=UPI003F7BAAF8